MINTPPLSGEPSQSPDHLHSENVGRRWDGLTHSYTDVEIDCLGTDLSTAPGAVQCELTGTGLT